uniref:Bardet-Biedl syndrome 10 protein homolog n=1 Tax=Myxine glutinosa TaxID=7769 RepID=UPI00358F0E02
MEVPLDMSTLLGVTDCLRAAVAPCLGPQAGHVVLTRGSEDHVVITSDGNQILGSLLLAHPIARLVVDCISTHCRATGDGAKSFVLLLSALLRGCRETLEAEHPGLPGHGSSNLCFRDKFRKAQQKRLASDLHAIGAETLHEIFKREIPGHAVAQDMTTDERGRRVLKRVLKSYFTTKVNPRMSDVLTSLACDVVMKFACGLHRLSDAVRFLLDNYFELCTEVLGRPVDRSHHLEGLVLHREFAVQHPSLKDKSLVYFVVFTEQLLPLSSEEQNLTFSFSNELEFQKCHLWASRYVQKLVERLVQVGVHAVLSTVKQAPSFQFYLKLNELSLVECLPEEEGQLLCKLANIFPCPSLGEISCVDCGFVGQAASMKSVLLGQQRCVCLQLENTSEGFFPCSLILCAPIKGLVSQSSAAFLGALKTLRLWLTTAEDNTVIPIEQSAANSILPDQVMLQNVVDHPMSSTTLPLLRAADSSKNSECLNSNATLTSSPGASNASVLADQPEPGRQHDLIKAGCLLPAGGTFELLTHYFLTSYATRLDGDDRSKTVAYSVLAKALLSIPQQLLQNHCGSQAKRRFLVLLADAQASLKANGRIREGLFCHTDAVDVLATKCLLVDAVVQCCKQLLTLDAVVPIDGKAKIAGLNSSDEDEDEDEDDG